MLDDPVRLPLIKHMLNLLAECVKSRQYTIVDRDKNLRILSELGMTHADQEAILLQLKPENFIKHESDRKHSEDDYWFFKTRYEGYLFYIKFKLIERNGNYAFVMSLHEDE